MRFDKKLILAFVFLLQSVWAVVTLFKTLSQSSKYSWFCAIAAALNAAAGVYLLDNYLNDIKYQSRLANAPVTVYDDGNFYDDDICALSDEELSELI